MIGAVMSVAIVSAQLPETARRSEWRTVPSQPSIRPAAAIAARVILLRPANWPKHGFVWLVRAARRLHPNVLTAALANKLVRIAWTVLARAQLRGARQKGGSLK
jgi:hypothetical protein